MRNYGMKGMIHYNNETPLKENTKYHIVLGSEEEFDGVVTNIESEPMAPRVNGRSPNQYTYTFNVNGELRVVDDFKIVFYKEEIVPAGGRRKTRKTRKAKKSKKAKSRKSRR